MSRDQNVKTELDGIGIKIVLSKDSDIELLHLFNNSYNSKNKSEQKKDIVRNNKSKEKLTDENRKLYQQNLEKARIENNTESWFKLWRRA